MKQVFISYSREDLSFVEKLEDDLKDNGDIEATYDRKILNGGDALLDLFSEIGRSDAVICVLSTNSVQSSFVNDEIASAIVKKIREKSFKFIPVMESSANFENVMEKMDDGVRTYIQSRHIPRFDKDHTKALSDVINSLLSEEETQLDLGRDFRRATNEDTGNPFARTRTENMDGDEVRAKLFAKPEPHRYNKITEVKASVIEGARGTGKTMILKSMQARIRLMIDDFDSLSSSSTEYFGVYIRSSQGSFETQSEEVADSLTDSVIRNISMTEIILKLVESLITEITDCKDLGYMEESVEKEKKLLADLEMYLGLNDSTQSLDDVIRELRNLILEIQEYANQRMMDQPAEYSGRYMSKQNLMYVCESIKDYLPGGNYTVYFLIDEYENLLPFQQEIVNTFVKWSGSETNFTFKIACKKPAFEMASTFEGQELEEPHDYNSIDLNYDISSEGKEYSDLLKALTNNIFEEVGKPSLSIADVLEERERFDEFSQEDIISEIVDMRGKDESWWFNLNEDRQKDLLNKYSTAAFYRLYTGNRATRNFGGLDDYTRLSSGIIRHFLELCSMAYYYEKGEREDPLENGISVDNQSKGAHRLSQYHLENIETNVEKHGLEIQQFLIDIGDILREKLLNHASEPEAAIIAIKGRTKINDNNILSNILYKAEEHSVLLKVKDRRSKTRKQPPPLTYQINRVYTPVLRISPNYRWPTIFESVDLMNLLKRDQRIDTRDRLIRDISKGDRDSNQARLDDRFQ